MFLLVAEVPTEELTCLSVFTVAHFHGVTPRALYERCVSVRDDHWSPAANFRGKHGAVGVKNIASLW